MTNERAKKLIVEIKEGDGVGGFTSEEDEALDMAIKALEQTRWIPVEERNPDKTGVYLATIKYLNRYDEYCYMIVKRSYYANVGTWDDSLVIAWMPLPPSYQGEENG